MAAIKELLDMAEQGRTEDLRRYLERHPNHVDRAEVRLWRVLGVGAVVVTSSPSAGEQWLDPVTYSGMVWQAPHLPNAGVGVQRRCQPDSKSACTTPSLSPRAKQRTKPNPNPNAPLPP